MYMEKRIKLNICNPNRMSSTHLLNSEQNKQTTKKVNKKDPKNKESNKGNETHTQTSSLSKFEIYVRKLSLFMLTNYVFSKLNMFINLIKIYLYISRRNMIECLFPSC